MAIKTSLLQGKARWAKVLGSAPPGYDNGPPEWSLDLVLNDNGIKDFLASGADKFYLKKNKDGETFVRFVRKAVRQDGTPSKPIRVVDHHGDDWNQNSLIGNDSTLNVQFTLNEIKHKGVKRLKPSILAIQVWDHKAYKPKNTFPIADKEVVTEPTQGEDW